MRKPGKRAHKPTNQHAAPRQRLIPIRGWEHASFELLRGKMRRISVKLPARLVKKLNEVARKYHRSRETIVRICAEDWLEKNEEYSRR
jgi:hypothetical protein